MGINFKAVNFNLILSEILSALLRNIIIARYTTVYAKVI
jgi:hypothetical protein